MGQPSSSPDGWFLSSPAKPCLPHSRLPPQTLIYLSGQSSRKAGMASPWGSRRPTRLPASSDPTQCAVRPRCVSCPSSKGMSSLPPAHSRCRARQTSGRRGTDPALGPQHPVRLRTWQMLREQPAGAILRLQQATLPGITLDFLLILSLMPTDHELEPHTPPWPPLLGTPPCQPGCR